MISSFARSRNIEEQKKKPHLDNIASSFINAHEYSIGCIERKGIRHTRQFLRYSLRSVFHRWREGIQIPGFLLECERNCELSVIADESTNK